MTADLRWPTYKVRDVTLTGAASADPHGALTVLDTQGRAYLDAVGGIGCAPLGHGHPGWVAAIAEQLARLAAVSNAYRTEPQQALGQALAERLGIERARVFLCSTGTEATEAAIKLALAATGRDTILAFERAFHGRTLGALSLTASPTYRGPFVQTLGDPTPRFASHRVVRVGFGDLEATRAAMLAHAGRIAAVFVEPIQGEAGVYPASRDFLLGLRALCDEFGALLGTDEIQSGSGRTGAWTAWQTIVGEAARPDLTWVAKALGGGFPVAACVARAELAEHMGPGSHGTTFGGNPVACAAALATIEIIEREGLLAQAAAQRPLLDELAADRPLGAVTEVRGHGAMIGIQIGPATEQRALAVGESLLAQGILVTVCAGHTVRLLFPYRAGRAELTRVWEAIARASEAAA